MNKPIWEKKRIEESTILSYLKENIQIQKKFV